MIALARRTIALNRFTEDEIDGLRFLCHMASGKFDPNWNCYTCNNPEQWQSGVTKQNKAEAVKKIKTDRGCFGCSPSPHFAVRLPSGGGDDGKGVKYIQKCPRLYEKSYLRQYLRFYGWYESNGTMPQEGGFLDQSTKYVSAMEIIRAEVNEIQAESHRKEQEQLRKNK